MSNKYSENRRLHLAKYAEKHHLPVGGTFKNTGSYGHILDISRGNRLEVLKYNLLPNLSFDCICIDNIHKFAHHLNSSQILCYNYFRPMLNKRQDLITMMKKYGISISDKAEAVFEHSNFEEEGTMFDFYLSDDKVEVFFEIKYTEDGFGRAKNDKRHKEKFDSIYSGMLKNCRCLKDTNISHDDFFKDYQLYRNVLRITEKNKYVVFITSKGNSKTYNQLNIFLNKINDNYRDNVIMIYWEDLINEKHPLYEKYIAEY